MIRYHIKSLGSGCEKLINKVRKKSRYNISFSKMLGTVELHGAKQVLRNPDTNTIISFSSPFFLPGDQVFESMDTTFLLKHRTPQAHCAVVTQVAPLRVTYVTLPPTSPFQPKLDLLFTPVVGDRVVFSFDAEGGFEMIGRFTGEPNDDVLCLLRIYNAVAPYAIRIPSRGLSLYTQNTVINHEDLDTFTIDPASSKDFDDAISVDPETNTVYVHIVDIAHATLTNAEQIRLMDHGLTLYLANEHTEHLLDEHTAAHRLSLIQGHRRNVITVRLKLADGLVESYDIYQSTISVKRRYNYTEVQSALDAGTATPAIQYLDTLAKTRSKDVQYAVNLPSVRLTVDPATGLATEVRTENTNDASHTLVATAMILANMTVSHHLTLKGVTIPNRFHAPLRGFRPAPVNTGNPDVDSFLLIKRYAKAYYSVDEKGHFGLDLTEYVHFTSPMRRYADVLVHNLLAGYVYEDLEERVTRLNQRATVVRSLQDTYERWKTLRWIQTLPVDVRYRAYITDVKRVGVMWFIPSLLLNGFSHVATLQPAVFWAFRDDMGHLLGPTRTIGVGDALDAVLSNINPLTGSYTCVLHTA